MLCRVGSVSQQNSLNPNHLRLNLVTTSSIFWFADLSWTTQQCCYQKLVLKSNNVCSYSHIQISFEIKKTNVLSSLAVPIPFLFARKREKSSFHAAILMSRGCCNSKTQASRVRMIPFLILMTFFLENFLVVNLFPQTFDSIVELSHEGQWICFSLFNLRTQFFFIYASRSSSL